MQGTISTKQSQRTKVILAIAVAATTAWMQWATPVISEECYYWLYGAHLDWCYFDHPGMIGWATKLGTWLLGDNALGLRLVAAWASLLTTVIGLRWIRDLGGSDSAERLWLALSLGVPLFAAGHLFATPDAPLTAFYVLTARELWKLSRSPRPWRFAWAGVLAGLALLSKYTGAFLLLGLGAHLALDASFRKRTRPLDLVVLLVSCALTFAPALVWNSQHHWESFLFQTEDRYRGLHLSLESPLRFLATQLLLFSPLLVVVACRSTAWAGRRARAGDERFLALLAYGLPLPLFMAINSFVMPVRIHWAIPAYVPLALLGAVWWQAEGSQRSSAAARRLGAAWIALSWVVCLALPAARYLPQPGGTHWDPAGEVGRCALASAHALARAEGRPVFLFTSNHRDSADLLWYQEAHCREGEQRVPVLAQNVRGRPSKQFDHWTDPDEYIGWDAIFALDDGGRANRVDGVRRHFDAVELVDAVELSLGTLPLRRVQLYACHNYRGPTREALLGAPLASSPGTRPPGPARPDAWATAGDQAVALRSRGSLAVVPR